MASKVAQLFHTKVGDHYANRANSYGPPPKTAERTESYKKYADKAAKHYGKAGK